MMNAFMINLVIWKESISNFICKRVYRPYFILLLLFTFCLSFAVRQTYFVSILKFIFSIFVLWHFFYFLILEEVFWETNEIMIMYVSLSLKTWFQDESQLFVCLFWACLHIFLLCFFFHFVRAVSKIVEYLFSSSFRLQSKMSYSFFFFLLYFGYASFCCSKVPH